MLGDFILILPVTDVKLGHVNIQGISDPISRKNLDI